MTYLKWKSLNDTDHANWTFEFGSVRGGPHGHNESDPAASILKSARQAVEARFG